MAETNQFLETHSTVVNELKENKFENTIAGKLTQIEKASDLIGAKVKDLGFYSDGTDPYLRESAVLLAENLINRGVLNLTITKASTELVAGYYAGGTITVGDLESGAGCDLEARVVTPTKAEQVIVPSGNYYGLSSVTINAIPVEYQVVTGVTATAETVLVGSTFVDKTGAEIQGSMANNGQVTKVLDVDTSSYTIAKGYHDGQGSVSIILEEKSVDPTETEQVITPTAGKVLSKVVVAAINKAKYLTQWTADATAAASEGASDDIFLGKTAYVNGVKVTGTMTDNSDWDAQDHIIHPTDTGVFSVQVPKGWHDGTGTVKIDAQNKTANALVPGASQQEIVADDGKVLHKVIVPALDAKYQDVSAVTADAAHLCVGYKFVDSTGVVVEGTLPELGQVNKDMTSEIMASGAEGYSTELSNGHVTGGAFTFTGDLYSRLANI